MNSHRVRSAKSCDSNPEKHLFVEVTEDSWLEVAELPTHNMIEDYVETEEFSGKGVLRLSERAFHIGIVKNWQDEKPIT